MDNQNQPWRVVIIESERGWGSKIDSIKRFATKDEALAFQTDFNKDNTETAVPDWYIVAQHPEYAPQQRK